MFISIIIAVILDFLIGDPYSFPHPVKLMGNIINLEEKLLRKITNSKSGLKLGGFIIVIINICLGFFVPFFILKFLRTYKWIYLIVNTYFIEAVLTNASNNFKNSGYLSNINSGCHCTPTIKS